MKKKILMVILTVSKYLGLFAIARKLTARDLRILCYHGASLADEHAFRPGLFMHPDTFENRMRLLADKRYPVLSLENAVEGLAKGELPAAATVITIDDGWLGTYRGMAPSLRRHRFPATLYIATYYLEKQTQNLGVALAYVFWRSDAGTIDIAAIDERLHGTFDISKPDQCSNATETILRYAEHLGSAEARQQILRKTCEAVGYDWRRLEAERLIGFMSADEARELPASGIDIQLHTHRHRLPDSSLEDMREEIEDNRAALNRIVPGEFRHFCYPSGRYTPWHVEQMEAVGIDTATTTKPGFNRRKTLARYELTRFLDSDAFSQLEFEAEMSGFFEIIRRCGYNI